MIVNGCSGLKKVHEATGRVPGMWKADIDSAFRRVPIKPQHHWATAVAFKARGKVGMLLVCGCVSLHACLCQVMCSQHYAAPLGAKASVIA